MSFPSIEQSKQERKKLLICSNNTPSGRTVIYKTHLVISQGKLNCWPTCNPKSQMTTFLMNTCSCTVVNRWIHLPKLLCSKKGFGNPCAWIFVGGHDWHDFCSAAFKDAMSMNIMEVLLFEHILKYFFSVVSLLNCFLHTK